MTILIVTDHTDDDQRWLETVLKGLDERSDAVKQALMEAVTGSEGAGPLLGLELTATENKQENDARIENSKPPNDQNPLLGTIFHPSFVRGKDVISSKLNFF